MEAYKKQTIKDWAVEDRPREKLLSKGINALSDSELIAILIRAGSVADTAVEVSQKILSAAGNNLNELGKWKTADFLKFNGVGEAKAIAIVSALELGRRRNKSEALERPKITSSRDIFEIMHPVLADLHHEEFWVLYLSRSNKIISRECISQGGTGGTVTDVKLILKRGIELLACAMILCHNHPSGNNFPSGADKSMTAKFTAAGRILDIPVLDHLIITDTDYFSFADKGELN